MKRLSMFGAAAVLVAAVAGAPAGAAVYETERYSGSESFVDDGCGYGLDVELEFSGRVTLRETQGGQAFPAKDRYEWRGVNTNPANGKWFVLRGQGTFNEIKATHVEGDIYKFRAIDAGQTFVMEDSNGDVVVRDRGVVRSTYLFDTLGDRAPGGDIIGQPDFRFGGPHASFSADFAYCDYVAQLVGD